MRTRIALITLFGSALVVPAAADMPPDDNRIMAVTCSVEEQCAEGGRSCSTGMHVDAEETARCEAEMREAGLVYRCRAWGNYAVAEVFCPPDAPGACTLAAQCPDGVACRDGEPCETSGHYFRCRVPDNHEHPVSIHCPEDSQPPPPGQNYQPPAGCGACSASRPMEGRRGGVLGCALLGWLALRRRAR